MAVLYADIERLIAAAGLESTIIRPGIFASNALFWWATAIRADGVVRWPYGAAETAPVDDRDVAAVAARTLYQDGHAGGDYVLTGPESLSQAEQVSIIGDVLGVGPNLRSCRRTSFEARRREAGRARSWTCCSPRGAQRSEGRRSSPPRCSTSSDRRRERSASGSPITPPRS
jgi:nucleoside-diphosphate-sugar epimerase